MAAAHVFVDDLRAPVLDDADLHHLGRVLRLRDGEAVTASDGRGGLQRCRFVAGALEPDGDVEREPRREPPVTIAFAPVKGDRPEWAVQKLTEVGVDRIVALECDRSVVRWDAERAGRHLERWARVAREAAMQSRRLWLPEVERVVRTPGELSGDQAAAQADGVQAGVVRADRGGDPIGSGVHTVLVGPEGGWSEEERSLLGAVGLTRTVLRTETAAVTAAVLVCTIRDGAIGRGARSNKGF